MHGGHKQLSFQCMALINISNSRCVRLEAVSREQGAVIAVYTRTSDMCLPNPQCVKQGPMLVAATSSLLLQ